MKKIVYRLTVSFDEYETRLLEEASKLVCPGHSGDLYFMRKGYRRVIMLALLAYARGVIKRGTRVQGPEIAVVRPETPAEFQARVKEWVSGITTTAWQMPNRWN